MSSITYSTELRPDPLLCRIVVLSGVMFSGIGVVLILRLPLPPFALLLGSVVWLVQSVRELRQIDRDYGRCRRLRLAADGGILLLDIDGNWHTGRFLPGSILLRRIGWIRVKHDERRTGAMLFRGSCRESHDWRRLQVIWRHIGAVS